MAREAGSNGGALNLRQVAAALGYTPRQIKALIKNGVIAAPDRGAYGALAGFSPEWLENARVALAAAPEDAREPRYGKRQIPVKPQDGIKQVPSPVAEPVAAPSYTD